MNNEILWFLVDQDKFESIRDRFDDETCSYLSINNLRIMKSGMMFISWEEEKNIQ